MKQKTIVTRKLMGILTKALLWRLQMRELPKTASELTEFSRGVLCAYRDIFTYVLELEDGENPLRNL